MFEMIGKLLTYAQLARVKVCLLTAVAVIIGAFVSGNIMYGNIAAYIVPLILAAVTGFLITGFGNTVNDYFDLEIDARSSVRRIRERPLPSGDATMKEAIALAVVLAAVGCIAAYYVSTALFYLAVLNVVIAFAYAAFLKKIVLIKNIAVAWLGASAFLAGSMIRLPVIDKPIMILSVVAFLATLSWEVLKDIRDLKNDMTSGVHTVPYFIGEHQTKIFSYILLLMAYLLLFWSYDIFGPTYLVGMVPALIASIYSIYILRYGVRQAYRLIRISTWFVVLGLLVSVLV